MKDTTRSGSGVTCSDLLCLSGCGFAAITARAKAGRCTGLDMKIIWDHLDSLDESELAALRESIEQDQIQFLGADRGAIQPHTDT